MTSPAKAFFSIALTMLLLACGCDRSPQGGAAAPSPAGAPAASGQNVQAEVIRIVSDQMGVKTSEVTPATHLTRDLKADELDQVELVMELEDEFEIAIPDEDVAKLQTVRQITEYVQARRKDPASRQGPPTDRVP